MDRFADAARAFAGFDEDREPIPGSPRIARSAAEHRAALRRAAWVTAVDGGSAIVSRRSNAALGVVKAVALRYDHPGLKVETRRYVVTVTSVDGYAVRMVDLDAGIERSFAVSHVDASGIPRAPELGIDIARALVERELQASAEGLVLADGSLAAQTPEEREACAALPENVLGVVKRSSVARRGASAESVVARFPDPVFAHPLEGAWYCRLHPLAERIVRVEGALTPERFDALLLASSDVAVPGYPYALVLADRFARVSNREARALTLEAAARFGLELRELHDVLDSLER